MKPGCMLVKKCVESHSGRLTGYAYAICGDMEQAKDAVQDAFMALCRQERIDENKVVPWLFKVCRNKLYDAMKRDRFSAPLPENCDPADGMPGPFRILANAESVEIMRKKLSELPPPQREILYLRFFMEKTYAEISELLDIPQNSVGATISRGIENLKKKLGRRDFYGPLRQ